MRHVETLRIAQNQKARSLLGTAIQALAAAERLPGPLDFEVMIPPVRTAWIRRVHGANLWLFYTFDDLHVSIAGVTAVPPIPPEPFEG